MSAHNDGGARQPGCGVPAFGGQPSRAYAMIRNVQASFKPQSGPPPTRLHPCPNLAPSLRKCFSEYGPKVSAL